MLLLFIFFLLFFPQTDQVGMYLLRADQDLINKFIQSATASTSQQTSMSENEIEYFIVNQDMLHRVLKDHKIMHKLDMPDLSSPVRRKSSSARTSSSSTYRFFSQLLFNEGIKMDT